MPAFDRQAHTDTRQRRALQSIGRAYLLSWVRTTFDTDDFAEFAGTSGAIKLLTLKPRQAVHGVLIRPTSQWAATGLASLTLSVGVAGDLDRYAPAYNVAVAPGSTVHQFSSLVGLEDMASPTELRLAAVATGANLADLTAGIVDIRILLGTLD